MTYQKSNGWSKGKNLLSPEIANSKTFKVINILSVLALLINTSVAALAVIPNKATAATIPLLTDTFESFSAGNTVGSPWSQQHGVRVENKDGDKAAELDAGDGDEEAFWTSFNTTGYNTIKLSYDRKTESFENGDHLYAEWRVGSGSWTTLENVSSNSAWTSKSYTLANSANNTANVQIRFRIDGSNDTDKGWIDNVKVEGDEIQAPSNVTNPSLGQSCGLDIALVIDSSGSISDTELTQMKDAYKGFVDAFLPNTPTQFSVTEFDDTAVVKDVDSAAGLQTFGNQISGIKAAINSANSGGYTNWEDGLVKGWSTFDPRPTKQNLMIFASDGNPNKKGTTGQVVSESQAVAAAVTQANAIKAAGTRIIALGIGNDLDINNLKAISGPNVAPPSAVNEDADVITANFSTLGATLSALANQLCGGKILVQKQFDTDGDGQVDVDGNTPNNVLAGWTFDVNGTETNPEPQTTTNTGSLEFSVQNGSHYSISETNQLPGTSLASAVCIKNQQPVNSADFAINTDETVTCTFVNKTDAYKLRVKKDVDTDGDGHVNIYHATDWTWDIQNGAQNIPTVNGDVWQTLPAGTYTISEDQKPGFKAANLTCIEHGNNNFEHSYGAVESATINLTNGDQTCVFTNHRETGTITVHKKVDNNGDGLINDLDGDYHNPQGWTWDLVNGAQNNAGGATLTVPTGNITVTEDGFTDYHASWVCRNNLVNEELTGTGTSFSVNIPKNGGYTCFFTNTRDSGRITFDKVVVGGNAKDSDFTFNVNNTNYKDGDAATFLTGSYAVTESGPNNYSVTNATGACSLNQQGQITLNVTSQGGTCVVTNTRDTGTLIVHKDVKNPDGGAVSDTHPFFVKLNNADQKTIAEGTDATYANLPTGSYTVTENPDGDYTWHSWSVDTNPGTPGAQVVITKGQTTELTVVNKQKKADITIKKDVRDAQGANISDNTSFSVTWEGQSFTIRENDSETVHVNPGTYTFTEGVNANYTIHSTNPKSITVGSDGNAEYTFENWKKAPLTIVASKIVCENESDLPDWGRTNPSAANITATTATDYVASHKGCTLVPDWSFQWGDENAPNPGNNAGATGNGHWHTFGPTNASGVATVQISDVGSNDNFWMREVMKSDYIPFDGAVNTNDKKVSAEIYCSSDVLNYDNYDRIDNPVLGETYHCVAFNVRKTGDIEGSKFNDLNGNGAWDEGEQGLANWTIKLWQNDTEVDSTVTDVNGHYSFTHLPTGHYAVSEEMQNGWTNTTTNPVTGVEVNYNEKAEVNFGNFKYGKISGYKYDWNTEDTLNGWQICLSLVPSLDTFSRVSSSLECVTTGSGEWQDGYYEFTGLTYGTYVVSEVQQYGWTLMDPLSNQHEVTVISGTDENRDFWNRKNTFDVNVEKTANKSVVEAGDTLTYTLQWSVTGNTPVEVSLFDVIPANTTYVADSADNGGFLDGNTVRWNLGTKDPAANGTVSFTVTVASPLYNGTQITNTGNVCGLGDIVEGEPFFSQGDDMRRQKCDDGSTTTTVHSDFGVTIDKSAAETVDAGGQLTYTINWTVTGNSPVNQVVVTDTLPANVTFASANPIIDNQSGNVLTWNLGQHNPGDNGSITVVVNVNSPLTNGTTLVNNAEVCGYNEQENSDRVLKLSFVQEESPSHCDDDSTTTVVQSSPILGIAKSNDKNPVRPLETINYTVNWSIAGNSQATVVTLTDTLPTQIELVAGTISDLGTYDAGTRTITWNLGTKNPGQSGFVTYSATANSPLANGTVIINTATIKSAETDPIFLTAVSNTVVQSAPVLTIDKTVDVQIANPGNTIKYTVTIQNTGTDAAHNVTLSDTLPAGFLFKDTLTPSKVFTLGELAVGASTSVSYEVLVGANVVAGFYDNLASAQADNHAAVKDSARVEVRVPQVRGETTPTLSLVKTVDVSVANPKDTVTYTVTIQNTSTTDATNVKLTDTLPDGFTFTDGTSAKTWEIGTLIAGATKTMTYKVKISKDAKSGVYENLAVVTADGAAPVEARAQVQVKVPKVLGATVPETGAGMNDILLFAGSLLLIAVGILFVRRGREQLA